jgi:hypothetical protein
VKAGALSTSPFVTFWFCDAAGVLDKLVKWWCETGKDVCKGRPRINFQAQGGAN